MHMKNWLETQGYDAVIDVNDWQREFEIIEVGVGKLSLMMSSSLPTFTSFSTLMRSGEMGYLMIVT
jgi:hypothetical protein